MTSTLRLQPRTSMPNHHVVSTCRRHYTILASTISLSSGKVLSKYLQDSRLRVRGSRLGFPDLRLASPVYCEGYGPYVTTVKKCRQDCVSK